MNTELVTIDPEILGGTPAFAGTRVPVAVLFENLADGLTLDEIWNPIQPSGGGRPSRPFVRRKPC